MNTIVRREFKKLWNDFHSAALEARSAVEMIPEDIDVNEECRLIDLASAKAVELAQRIVELSATLAGEFEIKEKAQSYLDGTYWKC